MWLGNLNDWSHMRGYPVILMDSQNDKMAEKMDNLINRENIKVNNINGKSKIYS